MFDHRVKAFDIALIIFDPFVHRPLKEKIAMRNMALERPVSDHEPSDRGSISDWPVRKEDCV